MGRPSEYTPVLAERIVTKLTDGKSLRWFDEDEAREQGFPSRETIRRWRQADTAFEAECARACSIAHGDRVEDIVAIADDLNIPPDHKKHMIAARQWMAEKMLPAKYGNKIEVAGRLTLEQLIGSGQPQSE